MFFKARDADALTAAFKEYTAKSVKREEQRPYLTTLLRDVRSLVKPNPQKERGNELER